jgi:hypothetical protein
MTGIFLILFSTTASVTVLVSFIKSLYDAK